MRIPKSLSYSSFSLFEKDPSEFYLRHLADVRPPRLAQENFMAIGAAFDAYVKSELHSAIFGPGSDAQFEFDTIFTQQVEKPNRDWARDQGQYVFDCYKVAGFYDELLQMLLKSKEPPRFEFTLEGSIDGVPFLGKPDLRFVHECGVHIVHDWKVKGYVSKHSQSPSKNYRICRDGYDAIFLGLNITKACPTGKPSQSHNQSHGGYEAYSHHGLEINKAYMEDGNVEYADQLSAYGWMLGEKIGDENLVLSIDETVAKYQGTDKHPLLRVANNRARVRSEYQTSLMNRIKSCWNAIITGHVFQDLSKEANDDQCRALDRMAQSLKGNGTPEDAWINQVVRPRFRH